MVESVAELVKKELKIEKAKITEEDKAKGKTVLGNLTREQVIKIAKTKMPDLQAKTFKAAVKQIVGSIQSMQGILIENKKPKEVIKDIEEGKWDDLLKA
jgi:large subunit ribosomal protein L11